MVFAKPALALDPVYNDFFGNAIKGYDPVAYFTVGKATKGDSDFVYEWQGADWKFSSQQNLEAFKANPDKYAPQYGGYCAWAVSKGYTAKIDPQAWHIHDGKLYLNYSKSVQADWLEDIPGNIAKGDRNWPALLAE
ncbi:YHS domain-containing (seleno)protein [Vibrio sp. SCSIO 43136]|uniref:YHS domain-containing (seleno)protein n=1 Tax=Vibrio sp. SCSIO 43136 TaxID=2819101 RepID=UPI00207662C4|nr:YHS domain-containing (seleno)protein [Vibrio sp. SCSIO 43136]